MKLVLKSNKFKHNTDKTFYAISDILAPYFENLGFKQYGNVFSKFVDTDIAQIIELENGTFDGVTDFMFVSLGIRVPECYEHKFENLSRLKKSYHYYQCNITCRLNELYQVMDVGYSLTDDPQKTANEIITEFERYAIPFFSTLNSRDNILLHRREFHEYDTMNDHLIFLEEAMIYGRRHDLEKAEELFNEHYKSIGLDPHRKYLKELAKELGLKVYYW